MFRLPVPASTLLALLALLSAACAATNPNAVTAAPPDLGVVGGFDPDPWAFVLVAAPVDATTTAPAARVRAFDETGRLARSFSKVGVSEPAVELWDELWTDLTTLSVQRLYQLGAVDAVSESERAPWRRIAIRSGRSSDRYLVDMQSGRGSDWDDAPFASLGEARGELSLRPTDLGKIYDLRVALDLDVGEFRWTDFPRAFGAAAGLADVANRGPASELSPAIEAEVEARYPGLGLDERLLIADLLRAFPNVTTLFANFVEVESLLTCYDRADGTTPFTEVDAVFAVDLDHLSAQWPELRRFAASLEDLVEVSLRLEDDRGDELARVDLDTVDYTVRVRTTLAAGRVVPIGREGEPLFERSIDPHMHSADFRVVADAKLNLSGVTLEVQGLEFDVDYESHADVAIWRATFDENPEVSVRGSIFGLVPVWAVDLMIPKNLEELSQGMLSTLSGANGGRGSSVTALFVPQATNSQVTVRVDAALEDSGLVGFMMRTFGNLRPDSDVRDAWNELAVLSMDAFAADFELLRRHYRVALELTLP